MTGQCFYIVYHRICHFRTISEEQKTYIRPYREIQPQRLKVRQDKGGKYQARH